VSRYDGVRARALRVESGIHVEELAAAAGVSPNTIRHSEDGTYQPQPRTARAIAQALGVHLHELAPPGPDLTLRELRRSRGLTQDDVAARIGVVRQLVSQVERGVRGVHTPLAWADAYGLTPVEWDRAHRTARDLVKAKVADRIRTRSLRGKTT